MPSLYLARKCAPGSPIRSQSALAPESDRPSPFKVVEATGIPGSFLLVRSDRTRLPQANGIASNARSKRQHMIAQRHWQTSQQSCCKIGVIR